jgi:cephalosporin hydroxylase
MPPVTNSAEAAKRLGRWQVALTLVLACLAGFLLAAVYFSSRTVTIRQFHRLYYDEFVGTWANGTWLGVPAEKNPMDLWTYQEIIHETAPDVLIEAGTADGGSAYYFATMFDLVGRGRVLTIDIADSPKRKPHPRITYLRGSSTAPEMVAKIRSLVAPGERVMVSLDSDHHAAHVARELKIYSDLVTPGCYLVVEDTNLNGHPVMPGSGLGPMEALREFLADDKRFFSDHQREKFLLSYFPDGWLKRIR